VSERERKKEEEEERSMLRIVIPPFCERRHYSFSFFFKLEKERQKART